MEQSGQVTVEVRMLDSKASHLQKEEMAEVRKVTTLQFLVKENPPFTVNNLLFDGKPKSTSRISEKKRRRFQEIRSGS